MLRLGDDGGRWMCGGGAMTYMLCRNRLADFARWKRVFDSHAEAHRAAGLNLLHLWRSLDNGIEREVAAKTARWILAK